MRDTQRLFRALALVALASPLVACTSNEPRPEDQAKTLDAASTRGVAADAWSSVIVPMLDELLGGSAEALA